MESGAPATVPERRGGRVARWWLDRSVRAKGYIVIAIPLAALILVTVASLLLQSTERAERATTHSAFVLSGAAAQVLADGVNAETGVRGYAATGRPLYLEPYTMARARLDADRALLMHASRIQGDAGAARKITVTSGRALAELGGIRAAVARGAPAASLQPGLAQGKITMDALRREVAGIRSGPQATLVSGRSEISGLESAIDGVAIGGLALGLLAGLAGVALFTSGISRRVDVAAANANRLGEGRPLQPAPPSDDELGRLARSVDRASRLLSRRESELVAARDQALQATQAKNAFLSNTSHELRTPLNSVLGFTQLLELSDLSGEDRDSVERILGAGRHLLALINELIDIARIESGELSLSLEPVPVEPVAAEAVRLMEPLAADRAITISLEPGAPALAVHADRQRLSQILVNLISNAVKYNRRGGTIVVAWAADGNGRVDTVVADTGPGMSAQDVDRIFVPFERLSAEQGPVEGTGIGLPLARGLARVMRGDLTAASAQGEGSTFTVSLPRAADIDLAGLDGAAAPAPRPPAAAASSVLYIEDNPANVEVVARYLRSRGDARLRSAGTGQAGLEAAAAQVPDIILLDLQLGDMRGEDVLRALRDEQRTAAVPVVILSAEASTSMIRRLTAAGAAAYLTKPLQLNDLGEILASLTPGSLATDERGPAS